MAGRDFPFPPAALESHLGNPGGTLGFQSGGTVINKPESGWSCQSLISKRARTQLFPTGLRHPLLTTTGPEGSLQAGSGQGGGRARKEEREPGSFCSQLQPDRTASGPRRLFQFPNTRRARSRETREPRPSEGSLLPPTPYEVSETPKVSQKPGPRLVTFHCLPGSAPGTPLVAFLAFPSPPQRWSGELACPAELRG